MKSLNAKKMIYIDFYQFEIFAIKAAEKKKKMCNVFHRNFKNIPYETSSVSLKRFYFALFDDGL